MVLARFINVAATMLRHVACSSLEFEKEGKFKRKEERGKILTRIFRRGFVKDDES